MKKLELKNLKVKKMSSEQLSNVNGGDDKGLDNGLASATACGNTWIAGDACTNNPSMFPLACGWSITYGSGC